MGRYKVGGSSVANLHEAGTAALLPFTNLVPVIPGEELPEGVRGLWIGQGGTINMTTIDGDPVNDFPALPGYLPFIPGSVEVGGSAADIWACI